MELTTFEAKLNFLNEFLESKNRSYLDVICTKPEDGIFWFEHPIFSQKHKFWLSLVNTCRDCWNTKAFMDGISTIPGKYITFKDRKTPVSKSEVIIFL